MARTITPKWQGVLAALEGCAVKTYRCQLCPTMLRSHTLQQFCSARPYISKHARVSARHILRRDALQLGWRFKLSMQEGATRNVYSDDCVVTATTAGASTAQLQQYPAPNHRPAVHLPLP